MLRLTFERSPDRYSGNYEEDYYLARNISLSYRLSLFQKLRDSHTSSFL